MIKHISGNQLSVAFYTLMNLNIRDIPDTVDISFNLDENVCTLRVQFDDNRRGYSVQTYDLDVDGGEWVEKAFVAG